MKKHTTYVGLDFHKNSIEIASANDGRENEVRYYGGISGNLAALDKVVRKLVSRGATLRFAYEAGPCGYEIYRHLPCRVLTVLLSRFVNSETERQQSQNRPSGCRDGGQVAPPRRVDRYLCPKSRGRGDTRSLPSPS